MISFDCDKQLDLCVYTSDKHFVRSRFILIAARWQRTLMILYFASTVSFVSARRSDLDTDQTAFHLHDYTISFEAEPVLRAPQRT